MKTTLASILVFTGLVLGFVIKKPAPVDAAPQGEVAATGHAQAPGKSEFDRPTTIAPQGGAKEEAAPAAEAEIAVEVLSPEAVKSEIETLQQYVVRENAITRLNDDSVSTEERTAWGKVFERLLALRSRNLRLGIEQAQASLQAYKAQHDDRVAQFVGGRS